MGEDDALVAARRAWAASTWWMAVMIAVVVAALVALVVALAAAWIGPITTA